MTRFFAQAFFLLLTCSFIFLSACKEENVIEKSYLFIGHSYQWGPKKYNRVDLRLEKTDWSHYDQLWLGGDLCVRSSEHHQTLDHLDSVFHISQPTTHWALGNHDINSGHPEWITQKTRRPSFYTTSFDGLCLLVLNTNFNHPQDRAYTEDKCDLLNKQFQLLKQVTDTIQHSSHLIILHHHALLTNELSDHRYSMDTIFHFYRPQLPFRCEPEQSFETAAYPLLLAAKKRGVEVLLIGGDLGMRQKMFQYNDKNGIWFLGSGINNSIGRIYIPPWVTNFSPDHLLEFKHQPARRSLSWTFRPVKELTGLEPVHMEHQ